MMPGANPMQSMLKMLTANPAIADNPQARTYIDALQGGDSKRGEEIADNFFESARSVLGRDAVIKMPAAISRLVA